MYLYRMVVRNLVAPLTYSELIQDRLEFESEIFIENQSIVEASFTFITAVLFLVMYYVFSNSQSKSSDGKQSNKKRDSNIQANKTSSRASLLAEEINGGPSRPVSRPVSTRPHHSVHDQ